MDALQRTVLDTRDSLRELHSAHATALLPRDPSAGDVFLCLISNPFSSQNLGGDAVLASFLTSFVLTIALALLFSFLRPYNSVVYAPRAKHADSKHAPPPTSKDLTGWIPPLMRTKEQDLVEKVGLDAAVFMRVCYMLRNMFLALTVIGCGILLPINLIGTSNALKSSGGSKLKRQYSPDNGIQFGNADCDAIGGPQKPPGVWLKMTPSYLYGGSVWWAYVVVAYLFNTAIFFFLWINYRAVLRLRRAYFDSPDYQLSLHSRTLMLTDIPQPLRSDDGIIRITDETRATAAVPRAAIARNVKDLPDLVEEHEKAVKELEEHLAKYLKNPDRLPSARPMTTASSNDKGYSKGQKVDAIDYLTTRIRALEMEIKQVRESVDKRNALSYGFASYERIAEAHSVAYVARKKGPEDTTISLAPKPNDLVWKNLKLSRKQRATQNVWNTIWIGILTAVWVVPNILIAIFLSNVQHITALAPGFAENYERHRTLWAIIQGVAAPAITTLFYFYLPAIFRRLCMNAGDTTKTSRDRHVMRALYSFFAFNNLIIFSFFSIVFTWVVIIAKGSGDPGTSRWDTFVNSQPFDTLVSSLCSTSPYWISWIIQRNLGAAIDLSQMIPLIWGSFSRKFLSPTPRETIKLTAPQPFDYASYYNYYLFCATVAVAFAGIQPIVLPVTLLYFWIDGFFKKYLIMYVFITKYESGGMYWRPIFNRILVLTVIGNCVIALIIAGRAKLAWNRNELIAMIPLPFLVAGFKWYCSRAFDDEMHYYQFGKALRDSELGVDAEAHKGRKGDRVGVRFGHPALYKPLITPMVSAKSQHLLKQVYSGRLAADGQADGVGGFSDIYLDSMDGRNPGKSRGGSSGPFEFVNDSQLDFEHYKNRPEFRYEAGGDGELYGHAQDMIRPGTPGSSITGLTRTGTWDSTYSAHGRQDSLASSAYMSGVHSRNGSGDSENTKVGSHGYPGHPGGEAGVEYPHGYHQAGSNLRDQSPAGSFEYRRPSGLGTQQNDSRERLVSTAALMGRSAMPAPTPGGYGPIRMGGDMATPGSVSGEEETSYDYFRRGRTQGM